MKEAIGGISIFQIVIVFIIVFTGYVCISINYSKAYSIKNELTTIIKNQGGVCTSENWGDESCRNFKALVKDFLESSNYRSTGHCKEDWVGYNRDGSVNADSNKASSFCVRGISISDSYKDELPNALYYEVEVFYQLDLPILNNVFHFSVNGETSRVYSPNECGDTITYCWCNSGTRACKWEKE